MTKATAVSEPPIKKKKREPESFAATHKMIYGAQKKGKTTLASHLKDGKKEPLFLFSEDGWGELELYSKRFDNWNEFKKFVAAATLHQDKFKEHYSCFVFDLCTEFYDMCLTYICGADNKEHPGDFEHGKGWSLLKTEFRARLTELMNILPCAFIAHAKEKSVKVGKDTVVYYEPDIANPAMVFINGKVETIMFIHPTEDQVILKPMTGVRAGSRYERIQKVYPFHVDNPSKTIAMIEADFKGGTSESVQVQKG